MVKKEITYDAGIIQEFAERLYSQAGSIIIGSSLLWAIVGGVVMGGVIFAIGINKLGSEGAIVVAGIGVVSGLLIGYARGSERAFKLKLDAQVALCQVQIEKNTGSRHLLPEPASQSELNVD